MAEMSQAPGRSPMGETEEAFTQATTASPEAEVNTLPIYEVGFHIVPTLAEAEAAAVAAKVRQAIGDAEIVAEGTPQRIHLAYTIERATQGKREKYSEAYFGWIKFALAEQDASREVVVALADTLRGMSEVLRHLIIKTVREDISARPARAVFTSDRLEGQTLKKPTAIPEQGGEVSEEELNKSIEALTAQ